MLHFRAMSKALWSKAEMKKHIDYERAQLEKALARKSIDELAPDGKTALMTFASSTLWYYDPATHPICVEQVTKILDRGADLEVRDKHQWTALFHAVVMAGSTQVIKLLLDRGANVNAVDKGGFTPLHFAAERGVVEIVTMLLEKGAKPDVKTDLGQKPIECTKKESIRKLITAAARKKPRSPDRPRSRPARPAARR
jgi:hypothetical protein